MSHRGSEIARPRVLNNQRPSKYAPKPKKERARDRREGMSEAHLALVRKLWCPISNLRRRIEPHHLKSLEAVKFRGIGLKAPDRMVVPLHWEVHWRLEQLGSRREVEFFDEYGINPHELADALWANTGCLDTMGRVLEAHQDEARKTVERRKRQRFNPSVGFR